MRQLQPKNFAMFVEGVPQFVKYSVGGFVVLCRQEPSAEFADFGLGVTEWCREKFHVGMPYFTGSAYTENAVGNRVRFKCTSPNQMKRRIVKRRRSNRYDWKTCGELWNASCYSLS